MTLIELNNKVQAFDVKLEVDKLLIVNNKFIVDRNKLQLLQGIDSEGKSLGQYARYTYKDRWEPVDLKLTGQFHAGFKVVDEDDKIIVTSTDEKTDDLKARYGNDIFGLTEENTDELTTQKLNPQLTQALQDAIS